MSDSGSGNLRCAREMFAVATVATAGHHSGDFVPAFPKLVTPYEVSQATSGRAFNSTGLAEAVDRLVGRPPFNVPAAGIVGILGSRTVANQGFAA